MISYYRATGSYRSVNASVKIFQEAQDYRLDMIGYDWIGCPILMTSLTSLTSPWEVLVAKPSFSTFNVLRRHKKVCYRTSGRQELHWQPRTSNVTESNRIDGVIVASLLGVHTESTCRETNAKASLHSHNICKANQGLNGFGAVISDFTSEDTERAQPDKSGSFTNCNWSICMSTAIFMIRNAHPFSSKWGQ